MRSWLAPEITQTSSMDCGPAALASLLKGLGIQVSYDRLREACQTDVDGTSIDTLELVASQVGLAAEQLLVPVDHALIDSALLPALAVVRLPSGSPHFVLLWRRSGGFVQVMNPATGRQWLPLQSLLGELYVHTERLPAEDWRQWAGSDGFLRPLRQRMRRAGVGSQTATKLVTAALADPGWRALATLDAAVRLVTALVQGGSLSPGRDSGQLLLHLVTEASHADLESRELLPTSFWSVRGAKQGGPKAEAEGEEVPQEWVEMRGAVVVHVATGAKAATPSATWSQGASAELPRELRAALTEKTQGPMRHLLELLGSRSRTALVVLGSAGIATAAWPLLQQLLLRSSLQAGLYLRTTRQQLAAGAVLAVLLALGLLLNQLFLIGIQRLGRQIELSLRAAFLAKLPRLPDRYFSSRLPSDMAERSHSIHRIRQLPPFAAALLRDTFQLLLTALAVALLYRDQEWRAVFVVAFALVLPLLFQPWLTQLGLRSRDYIGAMSRYYLEAMQGLAAIRTHGGEAAVLSQHETVLVEWARTQQQALTLGTVIQTTQALAGNALGVWMLWSHLQHGGNAASLLLLVFWAMALPGLGAGLISGWRRYPDLRSITLRLLAPLGAPETPRTTEDSPPPQPAPSGVGIDMTGLSVIAGGHGLLSAVELHIAPGEHVAVVGPSGAGKSTLVSLLLGWHRPATGELRVDGAPFDDVAVARLRPDIAWVDPSVQLWNRSLLYNLLYGAPAGTSDLTEVLALANLFPVLERMPSGLTTPLGESGGLVSGGEGQRVRLARALLRSAARLVILDEPFRGLDRGQRRALLTKTRQRYRDTTLLCITHDIGETADFPRVLVLDEGRIVEDGAPGALLAQPGSRYRALYDSETALRADLWSDVQWRRLVMADGKVQESGSARALRKDA